MAEKIKKLLKHQEELLSILQSAAKRNNTNEIVYKLEWFGYATDPYIISIVVGSEDVNLPKRTSLSDDIQTLRNFGFIYKLKEENYGDDDCHIHYKLSTD